MHTDSCLIKLVAAHLEAEGKQMLFPVHNASSQWLRIDAKQIRDYISVIPLKSFYTRQRTLQYSDEQMTRRFKNYEYYHVQKIIAFCVVL